MPILKEYRFYILGAVALIIVIIAGYFTYAALQKTPDNTTFQTGHFSFVYPRSFDANEYDNNVVAVGHKNGSSFDSLVEAVEYKSDPDVAVPVSFDAFVKRQTAALCGTDGYEHLTVTCTPASSTPYTSAQGIKGQQFSFSLLEKDTRTGSSTAKTYGPIYVFDTTATPVTTGSTTEPIRYSAVFVYPSFFIYAYGNSTTTPMLEDQIVSSLKIRK